MELDDFKNTWNNVKSERQPQQVINPAMLKKLGGKKYRLKMRKIIIPEIAGSIVCIAAAVFIGLNFSRLDTMLLQGAGIVSLLLLVLLPIISALSAWQLVGIDSVHKPYAATLKDFALQKIRFIKLQKLNVTLSYLLVVTIVILLSKLLAGNDLSDNKYFWLFSFTIGYAFLQFYARWVTQHYHKTLQQAEELLHELAA